MSGQDKANFSKSPRSLEGGLAELFAIGEVTVEPRVAGSKNDPIDLQILHEFVCRQYSEFRKFGGRASSPYRPFFFETLGKFQSAKEAGADATLTVGVQRPDGAYGSIDLIELFKELGFM